MGLFSSKKKHIVDSQVMRVIEDDGIPNPVGEATIKGVLLEDSSIVGSLLDRQINGPVRRFDSFYRYADKGIDRPVLDENGDYTYDDDGNKIFSNEIYYYGLPDVILHTTSDGLGLAKEQLEAEVGNSIEIDYVYFRPLNNVHAGLKYITEEWGYDTNTNILTGKADIHETIRYEHYLEKIVAVHEYQDGQEMEVSALGTMDSASQTGKSPVNPLWEADGVQPDDLSNIVLQSEMRISKFETESCEIHTIWRDYLGQTQRLKLIVDLTGYDQDREYYQAKYTNTADDTVGYWIYDTEEGLNDALNSVYNPPDVMDSGTYYPFVVFISEYENRADPKFHDTDAYKTTTKLLDKLDMDFLEISEALYDSENEGIEDVEQAVMMSAVPVISENPTDIDYLYRWFEDLYERLPKSATEKYNSEVGSSDGAYGAYGGQSESYAITFSDADFEMKLSLESLTFRLRAGNIGRPGTVSNTLTVVSTTDHAMFGTDPLTSRQIPAGVSKGQTRYIRKQLSASVYGEFEVHDMKSRYVIYKKKAAEAGFDDERVLIPIDRDVAREMSAFEREVLLYRSMHFVFNSHVVQKIKWYQRGAFKILVTIIAIVIIVMSPGFGTAFAAAMVSATAFITFLITEIILNYIIKNLIFQLVMEAAAKLLGPELAMLLAVVAAVVGVAKGLKAGSIASGTAGNLLKGATGLMKGVSAAIADELKEITEDFKDWFEDHEEKSDALKELEDALNSGIDLNPYLFVAEEPLFIAGETTDEYFSRSLQGNPGVKSLDLIENYADISLMLPTTKDITGV